MAIEGDIAKVTTTLERLVAIARTIQNPELIEALEKQQTDLKASLEQKRAAYVQQVQELLSAAVQQIETVKSDHGDALLAAVLENDIELPQRPQIIALSEESRTIVKEILSKAKGTIGPKTETVLTFLVHLLETSDRSTPPMTAAEIAIQCGLERNEAHGPLNVLRRFCAKTKDFRLIEIPGAAYTYSLQDLRTRNAPTDTSAPEKNFGPFE